MNDTPPKTQAVSERLTMLARNPIPSCMAEKLAEVGWRVVMTRQNEDAVTQDLYDDIAELEAALAAYHEGGGE